jgi:hypothetical protein
MVPEKLVVAESEGSGTWQLLLQKFLVLRWTESELGCAIVFQTPPNRGILHKIRTISCWKPAEATHAKA